MDLAAAAVCCGLGILIRLSNGSKKMTCQLLRQAIPVNDLKGLGECLENNKEIKNPTVVVRGTVGSTSTVDNSPLGVFIEERAELDIEMTNASGSVVPKSKTKFLSRKEVPWYLDDGTARVYVCNYRLAQGFYDTLKNYSSPEPAITYFKTFASEGKEKLIMVTDVDCWKHQKVLEIGTDLTVVGTAVRDKDGAPKIADAYRFFNGHIELDDFVNDLESGLETNGNVSLYLMALSAVLVALNMLRTDANDI